MPNSQAATPSFGAAKTEYTQFRPTYPNEVYNIVLQAAPQPHACAADLGAGTGIATNVLANNFESVIAVEPDAVMLAAGKFAPNVKLQCVFAEDANIPHGSCQLITCANAFYWMDGERLLFEVDRWLAPRGVFAAWRYRFPLVRNAAARELLQNELAAKWEPFRHERLRDEEYTLRTIQASALFRNIQVREVPNITTLTPQQLAGFFASTSYASAYAATLEDKDAYFAALAENLAAAMGGPAEVDFGLELIVSQI